MIETTLQIVGNVIAISFLLPIALFIIRYAPRAWKSTPEGVNVMLQKISFAVVILFLLAGLFLPEEFELARLISRIIAFSFVATMLWLDLRNLEKHHPSRR